MNTHIFLMAVMLCLNIKSISQSSIPLNKIEELKSGDRLPQLKLQTIDGKTISTSDLKGKLLILDFWGVNCGSCISAMPAMQKIQEKYKDQIAILLVTKNDSVTVRKAMNRIKILQNTSLPIIPNDTVLSKLFYYASVPTHVWIDTSGIVIEKTSGHNTSLSVIEDWLKGKPVKLVPKTEFADFEWNKPLFAEGGGRQKDVIQSYSIIGGNLKGLDGLNSRHSEYDSTTRKLIHVIMGNDPILDHYRFAFAEGRREKDFVYNSNRVILDVENPELLNFPSKAEPTTFDEWKTKNLYSYEIKVPLSKSDQLYKMMQDDLIRFFGYGARFETRKMKCLIITHDTTTVSSSKKIKTSTITKDSMRYEFLMSFISNNSKIDIPIINEVDKVKKIAWDSNWKIDDFSFIKQELLKYGIKFKEEERDIEMFIIYEF